MNKNLKIGLLLLVLASVYFLCSAVAFFIMREGEKEKRLYLEQELREIVEAKDGLAKDLGEMKTRNRELESRLNSVKEQARSISEEILKDNDAITIGKYTMIYHINAEKSGSPFEADGTMVLQTKKQRELLAKDERNRQLLADAGASVLLGETGAEFDQFAINRNVITIGKSSLANVKAKGFFLSGIQAKIVLEEDGFWIVNLGKKGKTKINGEEIDRYMLRNDDIIQVGKSVYRFIENRV